MEEKELIEKATKLYSQYCERKGLMQTEPSKSDSYVDWEENIVYLKNVNGELAKYKINDDGSLKIIQD